MGVRLSNRKIQVVVICMLGGVLAYNVLYFTGKKPEKRSLVLEEMTFETDVARSVTPNWATGDYQPETSWHRDPFTGELMASAEAATPIVTAHATAPPRPKITTPDVKITGVVISGDEKYVLAGDLLLREGDRLGSGNIVKINRDSVIVQFKTGTKTIYIE